jgi:hypothetical protein
MITEFATIAGVPAAKILERGGNRRLFEIRQLYWLLLIERGFLVTETARLCDRDHSTISNGVKHVKGLLQTGDRELTQLYTLTKNIKR